MPVGTTLGRRNYRRTKDPKWHSSNNCLQCIRIYLRFGPERVITTIYDVRFFKGDRRKRAFLALILRTARNWSAFSPALSCQTMLPQSVFIFLFSTSESIARLHKMKERMKQKCRASGLCIATQKSQLNTFQFWLTQPILG